MSLKRLSVSEVSAGCYAENFRYSSNVEDSVDGLDFSLKNAWDGKVDLDSVEAVFSDGSENSTDIEISYCLNGYEAPASGLSSKGGNEMVKVCHVPPGNPAAAHTIVISEQGWLNGHSKHHDDYLGECGGDDDGGGTVTPPDDGGGTVTPPDDGGGTVTPPDDGTTPPDDGGGTVTPPDDGGGTVTPPDDGGGTTPPDDGGAWDGTCSDPTLCGGVGI